MPVSTIETLLSRNGSAGGRRLYRARRVLSRSRAACEKLASTSVRRVRDAAVPSFRRREAGTSERETCARTRAAERSLGVYRSERVGGIPGALLPAEARVSTRSGRVNDERLEVDMEGGSETPYTVTFVKARLSPYTGNVPDGRHFI